MMPLPDPHATTGQPPDQASHAAPAVLTDPAGPAAAAPRPSNACPLHRAYPWLLVISTAIAALFCLLYITKPVILSSAAPGPDRIPAPATAAKPTLAKPSGTTDQAGLMPSGDRLPGDSHAVPAGVKPAVPAPRLNLPGPPSGSVFEETNLRVQHILTAEAPTGFLARLDIDVPVLYQSRNLRWTPEQVAQARELLVRLMDYQEKSNRLRAEGGDLLEAWNRLVERSLPASELRADSPSLSANQEDAAQIARPASLITPESIQIQPAGK